MKRCCSSCILAALAIVLGITAPAAADKPPCSVEANISPGHQNTTVTEGTQVTVAAQGNYPSYLWEQLTGPAVAFDPANKQLRFTAPQVATSTQLTFRLTVSGCDPVQHATAIATVTVTNLNNPPLALATAPSSAPEGSAVVLDGSGSYDPDGDPLTFSWSQIAGQVVTLDNASSAVASFTAPAVGPDGMALRFRLTVNDGSVDASQEVLVNVVNVNQPPEVLLTCAGNVNEGTPVSLLANATDDEQIASYSWSHLDGAPSITAADWSGASLDFTAPSLELGQAGLLTFRVIVTDNRGLSADATCQVQINDVTPPVLTLPGDVIAEATSASGAIVSFTATAADAHDGEVDAICTPASDSTFALGTAVVTCSAKDAANNEATGSFNVTVQDTTPPALTLPAEDVTAEATGPSGAVATFAVTALDLVDGDVDVSCSPESGSTFALGTTNVTCTARDSRGNEASGSFQVEVVDTTPPTLTLPADLTEEATGPSGASASFVASASDLVDGSVGVECTPPSGSTFALGTTRVTCRASDAAGNEANGSFNVLVVDTTPPVLTLPANMVIEATGPSGAAASFAPSALDLVSGNVPVNCTPASGSVFPIATTTVACHATDAAGNRAAGSFTVTVQDTTPPAIIGLANVSVILGSPSVPPYYTTPTATDIVDGTVAVTCDPGPVAAFKLGATTVNCSATDAHHNTATASFQVTVAFAPAGLCLAGPGRQILQPIAQTGTTVFRQAGSTVPVKFRVCDAAGNSYHATNPVSAFQLVQVRGGTATTEVNEDVVSTSADTAFRWSDSDQFWIFNLSTKGYAAATTYVFRISLVDGTTIQFQFGIK